MLVLRNGRHLQILYAVQETGESGNPWQFVGTGVDCVSRSGLGLVLAGFGFQLLLIKLKKMVI